MMRASILVVAAMLSASAAAAQPTQNRPPVAPRQIDLPDTLGANFSIADSATKSGSTADFDFLVGEWHFRFQQRLPDGTFAPAFSGHWIANRKRSGNAFIEDRWRGDNPGASIESGTWTYRIFNPRRKIWEMQGVDSESGAWAPGLMWSDDSNRFLIQHYGTTIMRIRYFNITPTSFSWRADASGDGGQT